MNIPKLTFESTKAMLGIRTHHANLTIEQPTAMLSIQQPPGKLNISSTPSRLTIDQIKAREDVDLKSVFKRTEESAQFGYRDLLEGIARRASEGNQLMKIENKGNPIAMIAKENTTKEDQFNIGWIPSHGSVKINYTPKRIDIQFEQQKPIIEVEPNKPIFTYSPGKVEYMMEKYPALRIDFVN
jgi:hypothetical protein